MGASPNIFQHPEARRNTTGIGTIQFPRRTKTTLIRISYHASRILQMHLSLSRWDIIENTPENIYHVYVYYVLYCAEYGQYCVMYHRVVITLSPMKLHST